ncbi:MAG: CoA pyrophosphatase [Chloroflexi bacterium]|nr:MAG: CoA pyrophosphatase [Chloroflexota bacterium]
MNEPAPPPSEFSLEDIRQALTRPLPGVGGQIKMAPAPLPHRANRWEVPENCREASVLLLLYPKSKNGRPGSGLHTVLIRRPQYPGVHSGQISFPGGRREPGESRQDAALRETFEEIGVAPENITIIGQLSRLYIPPSNFCIYPFVASCSRQPVFQPDEREVAELVEAPLGLFFDRALHKEETWHFENYGNRRIPYFFVLGHKVWGATAMILSEFVTLLTGIQPEPRLNHG